MPYTREELDWIEAEWAYHLHGRTAFLSPEDFGQIQVWEAASVPAEIIIRAMDAYCERRAKRARPRAFVKISYLDKDVAKGLKLREALRRAGAAPVSVSGAWEGVADPLRQDPEARSAFEAWQRLRASAPGPEAPGFLEHHDQERAAFRTLVGMAEAKLGPEAAPLREALTSRLREGEIPEGGAVWRRAWEHHWGQAVCAAWNIPQD